MTDGNVTEIIAGLDFSRLGSHWLDPWRARVHPAELRERSYCHRLLAGFIESHDVRPYRYQCRNLRALLRQGAAGDKAIWAVLQRYFGARRRSGYLGHHYGLGRPFDHVELWGRERVPLFLVGHPYSLDDDAQETLRAIRQLGLVVADYHPSWYGFHTSQIRVFHPGMVRRLCGQNRDGVHESEVNHADYDRPRG